MGTVGERHQWGVEKMGTTYLQGVEWVKSLGPVQADVGRLLTVAPIGKNPCQCAFTDGCRCYITLEVVGQNGTGRFEMRSAFTDSYSRRLHVAIGIWEFGGKVTQIKGVPEEH